MANERFQNALAKIPQRIPPIWLLRQAGRYYTAYQDLRKKHSFVELCKTPRLAAQTAISPVVEFDFDVAVLFSDLLFPLEALGIGLSYTDQGPKMSWNLNAGNLGKLRSPDKAIKHLEFQREAVAETRKLLSATKSLIGFVGGVWTLYAFAVENSHQGTLFASKRDLSLFHSFCKIMMPLLEMNIEQQLNAGAEIILLFDPAAGALSPWLFRKHVEPYLKNLADRFPKKLLYYSRETQIDYFNFNSLNKLAGLGIDHRWDLIPILTRVSPFSIQGNFDESLLLQDPNIFRNTLLEWLTPIKELREQQTTGWICGLGHGVMPYTPVENVRTFVTLIREVLGAPKH